MNYLAAFLVLSASGATEEPTPTLEWTLRYVVREIPEGTTETLEDAADYRKHKKEVVERASLTITTTGIQQSLAKTSCGTGKLFFAVIPRKEDGAMLYAAFQMYPRNKPSTGYPLKKLRYDEEIDLGGSAAAKTDPKKPGQLGRGQAIAFILVIKKTSKTVPQLVEESLDPTGEK